MTRRAVRLSVLAAAMLGAASLLPQTALAQAVSFIARRDLQTGPGPQFVTTADLDRDGVPDLVVANSGAGTVTVLLGRGDGSFRPPRDFAVGAGPYSVAVGDFDGDGRLDLAVANNDAGTVSVLLGNGDGTFGPARDFAAGTNPRSVVAGDFNHDGVQDLVVADYGANAVSVLLGNGDGTFRAPASVAVGTNPFAVSVGDLNGDGVPDVAVANFGSNSVSILLGIGDGTFQPARNTVVGSGPQSVAIGDLNRDGRPDLVVANSTSGSVSVLLGNGDGTFRPSLTFAAGSGPTSVAIAEIDGDGFPDLAVSDYADNAVSVLLGNGDGSFRAARAFGTGSVPQSVVVGDFNGDGVPDLAVANLRSNTASVLFGNGDGTVDVAPAAGAGNSPASVAVGDFNGDGMADLAVANYGSSTVSVLLGDGHGFFQPARDFAAGSSPFFVAAADFNHDGVLDLAVADYGANAVAVLLGNGDGTFQPPVTYATDTNPTFVAVGDVNGDGVPDLAVANSNSSTVSVLLGNGDGTFQPARQLFSGYGPSSIAVGDFNADGRLDLAATAYYSGKIVLFLGNGDGTFQSPQAFTVDSPTGSGPWYVVTGDFDGDGRLDLAVANYQQAGPPGGVVSTVSVLLGNGDGTFRAPQSYGVGGGPVAIALGDFNHDGIPDLAVANHGSNYNSILSVSVLRGNGDGTFQAAQTFGAGSGPNSVTVGDFNRDGVDDLVAANFGSSTVSVLINDTLVQKTATPTFTPAAGTYVGPVTVTLGDTTSGATIYYTTDGSTPTSSSTRYTGPVVVTQTMTVKAIATAGAMLDSDVGSAAYTILIPVAPPTFSPAGGAYVGPQTVTLGDSTSGAAIYYTTDGSTPTSSSTRYTGPITVARSTTLRAMATASGMADSSVASASYTIKAAAPTFGVPAGTYDQPQTVSLGDATGGATIYYTTDGSTPTTASARYTGPISVTRSMTIRAMAAATGMVDSDVAGATYTLQAATPTFDPPSGTYVLPQFVSISDASPGTTIYYTTDGSTPTTTSARYTGPILVVLKTTIRAIAVAPGWSPSNVASATYSNLGGL
jgi:chitobiase/beta-hexosaminidase-like protein/VCBS repeat protein/FG-GAP repeat protein